MGRYRGDRLSVIFEELARSSDIVALGLRAPDGKLLASGGQQAEIPEATPGRLYWTDARLITALNVDFSVECGQRGEGWGRQGRENMEDWSAFSQGAYTLVAVLDASGLRTAIGRHQIQLLLSICALFAALGLGGWVVLLVLKRTELAAELEQERERTRRQEQVAQLGAGLAHETKNPLGIVRGLAQSIGDSAQADFSVKDRAASIVDEVDRVIGSINSFLALARPPDAAPVRVELDRFFESFLPLVQMDALAAKATVRYAPCGRTILADENLLRRALLNLLLNALQVSSAGGEVSILVEVHGTSLALSVCDTGCGIASEDLPRVTEPYFTRFPGGSGLGLSIVDQIAVAHGWRLSITSVFGQGTQASIGGIRIVAQA
jgi:signal transduction histidine kinase